MAMDNSTAQQSPDTVNSTTKLRVVLQTVSHLVPGNNHAEKTQCLKNEVCQQLWGRDFDFSQDRWCPEKDNFGLRDQKCLFFMHHHGHDHSPVADEGSIPTVWYEWTGNALDRIYEDLTPYLQKKLKKWPFTWEGRKFHKIPRGPDGKYTEQDYRRIILSWFHLGIPLLDEHIKFLKDNPNHADWVAKNINPQLWEKIEPFCSNNIK